MHRVLSLLAAAAVLLAACGGSSSKTANSATTTQAPADTTSAAQSSPSTTSPAFTGSANSKYCQFAKQVDAQSNLNASADLKASFADFDSKASQFLSSAPSAIKADAQVLVDGVKRYEQVLKGVNFDATKLKATDLQFLQDPKFEHASTAVDAYNKQVCGIDSDTSTSAP